MRNKYGRIPGLLAVLASLALAASTPLIAGRTTGTQQTVSGFHSTARAAPSLPLFRFAAYFAEWGVYARDYVPADIPASLLTDIIYAFIKPDGPDGNGLYECTSLDPYAAVQKPMQRLVPGTNISQGENLGTLNQFRVMHRNTPDLQVLMSIGGASLSTNFPTIASTQQQRSHFAHQCVQFMQDSGFDGIDIDWEFPSSTDRANYTALLQAFRQELDALGAITGRTYPLTIAAPAFATQIANVDIPSVASVVSWINEMTYDFYGGWSSYTGHGSPLCPGPNDPRGPLWNSQGTTQQWLNGGMPASKIVLGMPYYGVAFQHLQNAGPDPSVPGRFSPVTAHDYVQGTWDPPGSPTSHFDYWDIKERFTGSFVASTTPVPVLNNYTRYWDSSQSMPFVFRPDAVGTTGAGLWLSFDDPQSVVNKVNYARTAGLGGVFAWQLSQESHPGAAQDPLTAAIAAAIAEPPAAFTCGGGPGPTATPPPSCTVQFTDVPQGSAFYQFVMCLACKGIISGYPDSTFGPANPVTRGQLSKIVSNSASFSENYTTSTFIDVPVGSPFHQFVERLASRGYITGYPCGGPGEPCPGAYFRPNANVTRGQTSKIVATARNLPVPPSGLQTFEDVPEGSPFWTWIEALVGTGAIQGYACGGAGEPCVPPANRPYFRPGNNVTRGQSAKIVTNTFFPACVTPSR